MQLCRCENQGPHREADIIRALSYLWCSDRESVRTAYGCPAHRATPRSKTFRSRGCGTKPEQTITGIMPLTDSPETVHVGPVFCLGCHYRLCLSSLAGLGGSDGAHEVFRGEEEGGRAAESRPPPHLKKGRGLLPKAADGLPAFEQSLTAANLKQWFGNWGQLSM